MGRNILRRTALVFLIFLPSLSGALTPASADWRRPLQGVREPASGRSAAGFEAGVPVDGAPSATGGKIFSPRQNQCAYKAWTINPEEFMHRREVEFWIEKWSSPDGLKRLNGAAQRYFPFRCNVEELMRSSGLPWETLAIPVVESNWRIDAVSSSGAAGPWQFLEASARGRHLIIDAWRDERRDVILSSKAAAAEISFYYKRLFSDWLLCTAAYNAGPTRIRQLRTGGNYSGFWDMLDAGIIPGETKNYVPQVIAVAWVTAHAGRMGLPIQWEAPPKWQSIELSRAIHLKDLAEVSGLSFSTLSRIHQELNHPVTPPPEQPYSIKVPPEKAPRVQQWLEKSTEESLLPQRFWRYTVRSGDTLSEIAEDTGIPLRQLLEYNGHVRSGMLRIGERLYLPGHSRKPPGVDRDELPVWTGRHRVAPGESLWSIARSLGVAPEELAEVNNRRMNDLLRAGSVLKVPGPEPVEVWGR